MSARYHLPARGAVRPQPVACRGGQLWSFILPADPVAVARLLSRCFSEATGGAVIVEPIVPWASLVFADLPRVSSSSPVHAAFGSLQEREAALWIPVRYTVAGGRPRAAWFVPYMFVDSGAALTAGRELLGLPKELAAITLQPEAGVFAAHGETVTALGPGATCAPAPLITVQPATGALLGGPRWSLPSAPGAMLGLLGELRTGSLPLIALRQLPDIAVPGRAALLEVVSLRAQADAVPQVRRLAGRHRVRLADTALHPIGNDLGSGDVVALSAAALTLDFSLRGEAVLWRPSPAPRRAAPRPPRRLAILGGGLASLSAAVALTDAPGWSSRWSLTVYQPGWRLGGKTASSRNLARGGRNEEHGLHVWFGFYRNAFRMLRRVYAALGRPPGHPLRRASDALVPQSSVVFRDTWDGAPCDWVLDYPSDPAFPGDPTTWEGAGLALPRPRVLIRRAIAALRGLLGGTAVLQHRTSGGILPPPSWRIAAKLLLRQRALARDLRRLSAHDEDDSRLIGRLLAVRGSLRRAVEEAGVSTGPALHRLWVVADSGLTILIGALRDGLLRRGFDTVDGEDLREWLRRHGAADAVVWSAPLKALYDASFSYAGGDPSRPDLAAGIGLATICRMLLTYEGAILWKARVGMGEAIIAPMYELLARRGVRFRFFHRVDSLDVSTDGAFIDSIALTEQARLAPGLAAYDPLVSVGGVGCFPAQPRAEQLEDGAVLAGTDASWLESGAAGGPVAGQRVLRRGQDYDDVLLGIGLGALPRICGGLRAAQPAWAAMLDGLESIPTQAVQLWVSAPGNGAIDNLTGDAYPSWIDMAPVLATEDRRAAGLTYGCGVQPDAIAEDAAQSLAESAVGVALGELWPQQQPQIIDQYVRVNRIGAERYERAASGTAHLRLPPGGSGFDNLVLAGAWTRTGMHIGSVEAAVMSGQMAATALDGAPRRVVGATMEDT